MKKKLYLTALVLTIAALASLPVVASANILSNADFELPTGNMGPGNTPTSWGWYSMDANYGIASTDKGQSVYRERSWDGGDSANIHTDPRIAIFSDVLYYFSAHVKTDAGYSGDAYLSMQFHAHPTNWAPTGEKFTSTTHIISEQTTWGLLSMSATAPLDATYAEFTIELPRGDGSGKVYFDDVYADVTPVPEPNTFILLGTGIMGLLGAFRRRH